MSVTEIPPQQASNPADVHMPPLSVEEIKQFIPHRYPFLLVDRVTEHVKGKTIKGFKNLSINEAFFQGHFPGRPIMPGVLQLEAMAQLGGVLMAHLDEGQDKLFVFTGIDNVRFRKMVLPGDRFDMDCELTKLRPPLGKASGKGYVNGELAVEADMTFALLDKTAVENM